MLKGERRSCAGGPRGAASELPLTGSVTADKPVPSVEEGGEEGRVWGVAPPQENPNDVQTVYTSHRT